MSQTLPSHPTGRIENLVRRLDVAPWLVHGVVAGLMGALLVALLFAGVDAVSGRIFWTPRLLGSALFLGRAPQPGDAWAVLVVGYTAVHAATFVAVGFLGATLLPLLPGRSDRARGAQLAVVLFVIYQGVFALFARLFAAELAAGWVAVANLLAAGGMAAYLTLYLDSLRAE